VSLATLRWSLGILVVLVVVVLVFLALADRWS
jgi:hypothetical protein